MDLESTILYRVRNIMYKWETFFYLQSQKREYMIINATKRRGGKTCVIGPPLPKVLTIIDQIHLGEIWHERTYKF